MNTGWREIDIHGCYWLVKISFVQFSRAKTVDEYDVIIPVPRDVTGQLSFTTMEDWAIGISLGEFVYSGHEKARLGNAFQSWLHYLWKSVPNQLTRDKIIIHGNPFIIFFIFCHHHVQNYFIWVNVGSKNESLYNVIKPLPKQILIEIAFKSIDHSMVGTLHQIT